MNITIRKYQTNDDTKSIIELCKQLGYEVSKSEIKQRLMKINNNIDHIIFLAKNEQKIIGLIHGYVRNLLVMDPYVAIGALVVDENFRNQGIGKQLLLAIESWAKEQDINYVGLNSNIVREEAHKFYEKSGYNCLKQQKLFKKSLNN